MNCILLLIGSKFINKTMDNNKVRIANPNEIKYVFIFFLFSNGLNNVIMLPRIGIQIIKLNR